MARLRYFKSTLLHIVKPASRIGVCCESGCQIAEIRNHVLDKMDKQLSHAGIMIPINQRSLSKKSVVQLSFLHLCVAFRT